MWWSDFQERRGEIHALVECDDVGLSQTIFTVKRKVERRFDEYKWLQVTEND